MLQYYMALFSLTLICLVLYLLASEKGFKRRRKQKEIIKLIMEITMPIIFYFYTIPVIVDTCLAEDYETIVKILLVIVAIGIEALAVIGGSMEAIKTLTNIRKINRKTMRKAIRFPKKYNKKK